MVLHTVDLMVLHTVDLMVLHTEDLMVLHTVDLMVLHTVDLMVLEVAAGPDAFEVFAHAPMAREPANEDFIAQINAHREAARAHFARFMAAHRAPAERPSQDRWTTLAPMRSEWSYIQ